MKLIKAALLLMLITPFVASAQTSAFNFQGRLNDGTNPANGRYDLQFKLFDSITGGTLIGQTDRTNTLLVNGVFSTVLDFGPLAFATGANRFLEIAVRPNGSPNAYVVLGARQQILAAPFSIRAATATNADSSINAQTAANSISLGGVGAGNYARLNYDNSGDIRTAGNIRQSIDTGGVVKAMIEVEGNLAVPIILRCYNGMTGASSGNCGFEVSTNQAGIYQVDFNFLVTNRFVSVSAIADSEGTPGFDMVVANYRRRTDLSDVIEVFTSGDLQNTTEASFTIVLY